MKVAPKEAAAASEAGTTGVEPAAAKETGK